MRPTVQGLLFRTFRMLFLLTMIAGFFSACVAGLEGLRGSEPPPPPAGQGGAVPPAPAPR